MFIDYLKAIIFGVVQGITEFLPVSSSGHLIIFHEYLSIPVQNEVIFDVLLHLATLLAVIIFFWSDIKKMANSWVGSFFGKKDEYSRLSWYILIATIPAALVGYFFGTKIEENLRAIPVVALMLVLVGILFIVVERISPKIKNLKESSFANVFFVGLAQTLALVPGTSRSGITIIAGLLSKLKREDAIRLSFLMSIPIIAGASIINIGELIKADLNKKELIILIISFGSTFASAFFTIKYFLKIASKFGLVVFAYYRFFLAFVLMILWYFSL